MVPVIAFQVALCAVVIPEAYNDVVTIEGRVCDYVIFDPECPQLEYPFRISWRKGNTSSQRWMQGNTRHGQRVRVFPNGTLGLHVVGKEDAGWYTAMVCNSSQHCPYQRKFQLRVHEQKEAFRRILVHVLFYILIASVGVVFITILVALIWHFQKHKGRSDGTLARKKGPCISVWWGSSGFGHFWEHSVVQILIPSIHHASLILADEGDNPEKCEEGDENSRRSENDENPSVQGLDGTNSTEQRSKGFVRSNKKAINPAAADKVPHFSGSTFQDGERGELSRHGGMTAVKPPALVNEMCVTPNAKNTTHPEFEHSIPPAFDGCAPAELNSCSPPGSEGLKDDYVILCNSDCVTSGSIRSWKCSEGDMPSQYALMDSSKRGLPEDKSGDSVCSSFYRFPRKDIHSIGLEVWTLPFCLSWL
ncbi:uncharacterized protein LOC142053660 [Phalacrocorax aristotelis]|uniref:uncharacterized protein LOC142053660 n=1 Tax=Phalacrocorax aristotelis TaxID=126867 RepID=UPI003F4B4D7F